MTRTRTYFVSDTHLGLDVKDPAAREKRFVDFLKGIPADIINEAMTLIDEEQYRKRLIGLLQAKWRTVNGREPRAAWAAMMRFAASRGFEAGIAGDCVKQVTRLDAQDD